MLEWEYLGFVFKDERELSPPVIDFPFKIQETTDGGQFPWRPRTRLLRQVTVQIHSPASILLRVK